MQDFHARSAGTIFVKPNISLFLRFLNFSKKKKKPVVIDVHAQEVNILNTYFIIMILFQEIAHWPVP